MKKTRVEKQNREVQFTVVADRRVRDRLKVLGAIAGGGMGREAGRRLAESIKRDAGKPITLGDNNA